MGILSAVSKEVTLDGLNVVTAARQRIINAFSNGVPVYATISGGKDSIVLAHLLHSLVREGRIDPTLLHVYFIDEEAIFDSVDRVVRGWRRRFREAGVDFRWYCIEVKHFSCFNQLTNDESFICWDSTAPDTWIRPMPAFAVTDHPMLRRRVDTYQEFLRRVTADGIGMTGVRIAESLQRRQNFNQTYDSPRTTQFQPIYDWKDSDVWLYIREHDLDFPETYMHMYQVGATRKQMRISQFFSIDTARSLVQLNEFEPDLMARVMRREPNAYLASLYWETEMFRRAGGKGHAKVEGGDDAASTDRDWKALALDRLRHPEVDHKLRKSTRGFIFRNAHVFDDPMWRNIYQMLVAGDPKQRTMRALYTHAAQLRRAAAEQGTK